MANRETRDLKGAQLSFEVLGDGTARITVTAPDVDIHFDIGRAEVAGLRDFLERVEQKSPTGPLTLTTDP